jgi:hypothetical protein
VRLGALLGGVALGQLDQLRSHWKRPVAGWRESQHPQGAGHTRRRESAGQAGRMAHRSRLPGIVPPEAGSPGCRTARSPGPASARAAGRPAARHPGPQPRPWGASTSRATGPPRPRNRCQGIALRSPRQPDDFMRLVQQVRRQCGALILTWPCIAGALAS